jgi:hypothetical protein
MKSGHRIITAGRRKPKKRKTPAKSFPSASIAQRYMELRSLRERISEVEAWRNAR